MSTLHDAIRALHYRDDDCCGGEHGPICDACDEGNLGYVTFSVPAASGLPVGEAHPQGPDAHGEWRHFIEVEVVP